ncbi:tyrosine-type recombinase/integrase [Chloroflexota bacterium]
MADIIAIIIVFTILVIDPFTLDAILNIVVYTVVALIVLPVAAWILKQKNRSLWWLCILFVPYLGLILFLILGSSESKLSGEELDQCLAYIQEHYKLTAFQEKEADLYNNALVQYGGSLSTDSQAAQEMVLVAKRFAQSARELRIRSNNIVPIPEPAAALHLAWHIVFSDLSAWVTAQCAAIEATANGMAPGKEYVRRLFKQTENSRKKAENEERKFLMRMRSSGLTVGDFQRLESNAATAVGDDNWQPSITVEEFLDNKEQYGIQKERWSDYWGRVISTTLVLQQHRTEQRRLFALLGNTLTDDDYVFCHYDRTPLDPSTISHTFANVLHKAGLPSMPLHGLRHSHATMLLQAGTHPRVVMERLGHSSIRVTIDTYSHVVGGLQELAAQKFDDFIEAKNKSVSNPLAKSSYA